MRVGIVTPQYPPNTRGGGEISAQLLAEQLAQRTSHHVEVHSFDGNKTEKVNGILVTRHRNIPRIPEFASIVGVYDLFNRVADLDIIHGYNMELHPAIGLLTKVRSVSSVAHLNSYTYINKRQLGMELEGHQRLYNDFLRPVTRKPIRWSLSRIDRVIALSKAIEDVYTDYLGTGQRINRITNMIDPNMTPEAADYDISDKPKILYIGSLDHHKGVRYLVQSIDDLNTSVDLRVVGGGKEFETLQRIVTSKGLSETVDLCGTVPYDEISRYYEWGDVFVHPGIWPEPLNRTLLEAMQYGLATVVTDRGGPPETIHDEDLVVDPADHHALARGIETAIEKRHSIGKRNRKYILENHHPKKIIPKIDELYRDIV